MTTPNRPPLSPAAQAVLDAVALAMEGGWISPEFIPYEARKAAAALRAAAIEIDAPLSITHVPEQQQRWYGLGVANFKRKLLAIAAELEAHHD